jgi:hypothetical protein
MISLRKTLAIACTAIALGFGMLSTSSDAEARGFGGGFHSRIGHFGHSHFGGHRFGFRYGGHRWGHRWGFGHRVGHRYGGFRFGFRYGGYRGVHRPGRIFGNCGFVYPCHRPIWGHRYGGYRWGGYRWGGYRWGGYRRPVVMGGGVNIGGGVIGGGAPRTCPPGTHLGYMGRFCWPDRR